MLAGIVYFLAVTGRSSPYLNSKLVLKSDDDEFPPPQANVQILLSPVALRLPYFNSEGMTLNAVNDIRSELPSPFPVLREMCIQAPQDDRSKHVFIAFIDFQFNSFFLLIF